MGGWGGGAGDPILFIHISSSWVEISFYTEFQISRLRESRTASFRLNPIYCGEGGWGG